MTITITHPESRSHQTRSAVITALLAVCVAIAGFTIVQTVRDGGSGGTSRPADVTSPSEIGSTGGLADWARANGFSGLSPASVGPVEGDQSQSGGTTGLTDWARANGFSGLSPASVGPVEGDQSQSGGTTGLANFAETNGLSGLSPVSLQPTG